MNQDRFWAKTLASGEPGISVRDHCMNVGCVAEAILDRLLPSFAAIRHQGAATLAAFHDVGKISPGFQAKCDAWIHGNQLARQALEGRWKNGCETDHARISQWVVQRALGEEEELSRWAVAVGSHHGRIKGKRLRKGFEIRGGIGEGCWEESRETLSAELLGRFGPLPVLPPSEIELWWLAGLITVADWIGSDEEFFSPEGGLPDERRDGIAAAAIEAIQWHRARLRGGLQFGDLFPGFDPSPLQRAAWGQIDRPGVYLIEGAMGCGKTEAALAAAYRLIDLGHAGGLYFALPTQTTSNKIHERVSGFLRRSEAASNELRLIHGSAWLSDDFHLPRVQPSLSPGKAAIGARDQEDEATVAREHARSARSWFASGKRALLASFGVGTVDQALLGIVAAKHFFVRQFGLAGKVVILDEVHTYDLYTGTLLDALVRRLRELGSTVLILSATLSASRREELLRASGAAPVAGQADAYPLLTLVPADAAPRQMAFPAEKPKAVGVSIVSDSCGEIADLCLERAGSGQCVLWIRNTVDEAQEAYRLVKNGRKQDGPKTGLLHARFPLWRRQDLEKDWLDALGKHSCTRPEGAVLVATQVVEQSVDIDADFLVSDLAPTDMLLQRIGRLWRHERPGRSGRPEVLIRTDGLAPGNAREGTDRELRERMGRSAFVYAPYILLRSLQAWGDLPEIVLPGAIRPLIEATYGEPETGEPDSWAIWRKKLEARRDQLRQAADTATLVFRLPALPDEEGVQTRWIDRPTTDLLLAASPPDAAPGAQWFNLSLSDGTSAKVPRYGFDLAAARALHSNLVRIPRWAVPSCAERTPDWLANLVSPSAVLGVVRPTDGAILVGGTESGMAWHPDEGVILPRRENRPSAQPADPYENDPYDESYD